MSTQLEELIDQVSERGEPRGARVVFERTQQELLNGPRRKKPFTWSNLATAGAAAALVALAIAAVVIFDPFGSEAPFIEEPTTVPTTTVPVSTTEASEPTVTTSTTVPAVTVELPVIDWTRIDDPVVFGGTQYQGMSAVTSGPMGLIAVGVDWDYPTGADLIGIDGAVWTSADGVTWSRVDGDGDVLGGLGDQLLTSVVVGHGTVVAGGFECPDGLDLPGCIPAVWVSEDTVTWEKIEDDDFAGEGIGTIEKVIATDDGFLAVGSGVWTSPDGRDWERVGELLPTFSINEPEESMAAVVHSPGGYVAAGSYQSSAAIWVSENGSDWTAVENNNGLFGWTSDLSWVWIEGLLDSGQGLVAVGHSGDTNPDSAMVWRTNGDGNWEQIVIERATAHRSETMTAVAQVGDWIFAAGTHNDFTPHNQLRAYYAHGAILIWGSNDQGSTWTVLPTEGDVLGNYLSDKYPTWVGDLIVWNDQLVMVGSRGNEAQDGFQTAWDAAVWIGTIEE